MESKKHYTGDFDAWEKKLSRVCERLGVPEEGCRYDWTSSRGGNSCYVEICIAGVWRRLDNSTEKSAACGRGLIYASDLLRTHPDNQPNEPLRWRSCKKEKPTEKGRYEVVCRNGDIPPYVLLGFYDPDNPGWDLYGVTHWRPLPEPPKEA